ncbi:sacsin N-terminal ATP-binding-like domain-containing protein [Clostridium butyricum]|uniref:sacsin N-terminal ATP-binding-like domain-containing protein n=1 Tax=Clostridium butyricum TaxID=1492 RepID=UPI003D0C4886
MFSDEIYSNRKQAHEAKVANTIIDLLTKLKLTSNDNSKLRWIWELIQNAKDVANSTGKVKININIDKENNVISFAHNGKLFTTKSLVCLIEQVSSKDRENLDSGNDRRKITGKFGTGFLTTHLLSSKVVISGILQDENDIKRSIKFELDRSGKSKNEIIESIHKSYDQIENNEIIADEVNEDNFNTIFTYDLDNNGTEVAKQGLENLYIALPYVFAFVPEIEMITINGEWLSFQRREIHNTENKSINIHEILLIQDGQRKNIFTCVLKDENIAIAIPILDLENKNILEYSSKLPKIFCDFPLIGTEEFAFPVVINSPLFNPTEPRDSIFLSDKNEDEINENKNLLLKACELYGKLLDYISNKEYRDIYNITKIKMQSKEEYISAEWVNKNVVEKCKEYIKYKPIIELEDGSKKSLYNDFLDECNIWIISNDKKETREEMWHLISYINSTMLTKKSEIHYWYNSLWNECHNFRLMNLVKEVEKYKSLENIEHKVTNQITSVEWLNKLYNLICENEEVKRSILENDIKIFPNQNGELCSINELKYDVGIDEVYKKILKDLDYDCKENLLYYDIELTNLITLEEYKYDDIFIDIQKNLSIKKNKENEIYKEIIVLYNESNKEDEEIVDLIKYIDVIFPNYLPDEKEVNEISKDLLNNSIKYLCVKLADKISSYVNVKELSENVSLNDNTNIEQWIVNIIEYFIKYDHSNLLNKKSKPILPNQNGVLKIQDELFLDSGELDEELKDISCSVGNDVRENLLIKDILLKLPETRTKSIEDVVPDITTYVKKNQGESKNNETVKNIYKKFYLWIRDNEEKAKKYFPDIYKNKHWLYDDDEIAECMKNSNEYDEVKRVLKEYDIKDMNQLRKLLDSNEVASTFDKVEIHNRNNKITEELLLQYGIYTQDELNRAIDDKLFGENFVHNSEKDKEKLDFVNELLDRSKNNVMNYLRNEKKEYDLTDYIKVDKTIFIIKKDGREICLIIRPSDYDQVIVYYESEKDVLESYSNIEWELWVENGKDSPQQLTFGKILKLLNINRIPLRRIR